MRERNREEREGGEIKDRQNAESKENGFCTHARCREGIYSFCLLPLYLSVLLKSMRARVYECARARACARLGLQLLRLLNLLLLEGGCKRASADARTHRHARCCPPGHGAAPPLSPFAPSLPSLIPFPSLLPSFYSLPPRDGAAHIFAGDRWREMCTFRAPPMRAHRQSIAAIDAGAEIRKRCSASIPPPRPFCSRQR